MDAVILAAGRGTRVADLTPEFHKPLLPVDGVPLVCRAVDLAHSAGVETPVVVAAPDNVAAIHKVLGTRDVALAVQRAPRGPGDALTVGLLTRTRPVQSNRVLVLLSDNVSSDEDVLAVTAHETAVGVKLINYHDARRFTRYENGRWVEKTPLFPGNAEPRICWIGPFIGWRQSMENTLLKLQTDVDEIMSGRELLIGPHLNALMKSTDTCVTVQVSSYDVGTVDAYNSRGRIK